MPRKRLGVLTGGGDCPGLNAVIRAVVKTAISRYGFQTIGFQDGFEGMFADRSITLDYDRVSNILTQGGTILGAANKGGLSRASLPSHQLKMDALRVRRAVRAFTRHKLAGLVCIGGDGTLTYAHRLETAGVSIIGVPKTIDNDVMHTDQTFGFDTAFNVAAHAVDRLHSTAESHQRVMMVEVMGRDAGWIALYSGLAAGGDVILIPEIPFNFELVCRYLKDRFRNGRRYGIVVVAEGAAEKGGRQVMLPGTRRLGGIAPSLATRIEKATGIECRATILGYLQRGGTPTPFDRLLATRYGNAAARLAAEGRYGRMVCLTNNRIDSIPLSAVAGRPRRVPLDSSLIATARDVGTCFGDEPTPFA